MMIKVQNNTAVREPIPTFLSGLNAASLFDLSWTDPALGVQDCAWWPEEDQSSALGAHQSYDGTETLTPDAERKVVVVVRGIRDLTLDEVSTRQLEKDQSRYQKRAAAKDQLMAYMAADNMGRVRSGVWTVADLTSLLDDPEVVAANALMGTLSFELAAQQISAATTPLLTPEIKADWVSRLEAHYYLEG